MIEAIKYKSWHSYAINLREQDALSTTELHHDPELLANGPAITIVAEHIVASIGYLPNHGVAHMWMITSPLIHKYRFWMYRNLKQVLDDLVMKEDLHRLQAVVRTTNEPAKRWIEHLGFQPEGIMRKLAPNADYVLYARLNDG